MGKLFGIIAAAAGIAGTLSVPAAEKTTEITTSTITTTVIKEKTKWQPFRVCVLDFSSTDIQGQKRFLDQQNRPIVIPPQSTLNDADRKSINSVMQGFVRMIDAWDNTRTNTSNRLTQEQDNTFSRAQALELYNTVLRGETRPMVLGAEYLAAYLGRHNDVFGCIDAVRMTDAMNRLQQAPDFPQDFMLRLAKETGATHLIYGTVSDPSKGTGLRPIRRPTSWTSSSSWSIWLPSARFTAMSTRGITASSIRSAERRSTTTFSRI